MRTLTMTITAAALLLFGRFAAAEPELSSTTNVNQVLELAHSYLWQVDDYYWHHGDYDRCIALLRLITRIDPSDTDAYGGAAWLMQSQLRDDEAEALLLEGLPHNLDNPDIFFELGYYYYMHERFDEAISYLEGAVAIGDETRAWHMLAHSYEQAGDVAAALSIWADREAAEPADPVPTLQLDRILSGEPPSSGPAIARQGREERLRERQAQ